MPESTKNIPVTFANTGIVLRSTPDEIPITSYKLLVNMITDQENSVAVRQGFQRLNNGLPSPPHSSFTLRDAHGAIWRYAIAGAQLYVAQVSPVSSDFVAVIGGNNLSSASDPRALFAEYNLFGLDTYLYGYPSTNDFMFMADGQAFLKHPGGTVPARRIGIPAPVAPLTIAVGTPVGTTTEHFEDHTTFTAVNMVTADVAQGVINKAMETDVTGADVLGYATKSLGVVVDFDNANLDNAIQWYIKFPSTQDLNNYLFATIEFNLSSNPGDTSFKTFMRADVNISGVIPGAWSLQSVAKKDCIFQGVDTTLNWSTVTAIRVTLQVNHTPIANPNFGGALTCSMYWDELTVVGAGTVNTLLPIDLQWVFTYYDSQTDTESDFSPIAKNPFSANNISYALTFPVCPLTTPPLANPDLIRIYRMGSTITQFQRVDEIPYTPGLVPAVYTDGIPDSGLGVPLELDNQLPPDNVNGVEISDNRLWTWGGSVNGLIEPANRLRFSKRVNVEEFPAQNYIYVGSGGDPIQRVLEHDGELFVFTLTRVFRIVGTDLNTYQALSTPVNQGLMSPFGICRGTRSIYMYAYDGVYEFPSGTKISEPINQIFFGQTVNEAPAIMIGREHEIAMAFWNSKMYFSYPRTSDSTIKNDSLFIWDMIYQRWHFYLYGAQGLFTEKETRIIVGSNVTQWDAFQNGVPSDFANAGPWVMQLETGFVDVCQNETRNIFYALDTKEFDLGYPDQEKRFIDYVIDANTNGFPAQIQLTFDGAALHDPMGNVTTNGREQIVLPVLLGAGDGTLARRVSIRIIGRTDIGVNAQFRFYKVIHRILLEPMKHRTFVTEWHDYGTPGPKFFRELWIDLDTFGFPLDSIEVQIDQAVGAVIRANTTANGRTRFYYGMPPDLRGTLARLKVIPSSNNEVKLYDHSFQTMAEPPVINSYQMPWSEEGWPYPKLWKEVLFDIDTNNLPIGFDFWLDNKIVQSFDLQADGRQRITKSLNQDLFGKLGRVTVDQAVLDPFCCLPQGVRVYSIGYVTQKDPADVTFSDSYEQLLDYDRTKIIRRLWIAMKNPDAPVTMELYVDDVLASTKTVPRDQRPTGHNKKRIDLESNIEGRLIRIFLSSPFAFQTYWEKSEIEMKGTNPDDGYGRYKMAPPQTL